MTLTDTEIQTNPRTWIATTVAALVMLSTVAAGVSMAAGGTTVSIEPTDPSVGVGETTTVAVVVDSAQDGVGAAELNVTVGDTSVATITDATVLGSGVQDVVFAGDGSAVDIEYAFRDTADTGPVSIVEVTIQGEGDGTTSISLAASQGNDEVLLFDEGGIGYDVTGTNSASLTVEAEETPTPTPTPEPAGLVLTGLSPADTSVTRGDSVTVTATVRNGGDQSTTASIVVRFAGADRERRQLTLDAGETRSVTFEVDTDGVTPGEYDLVVAGSGPDAAGDSVAGRLVVGPPAPNGGSPPSDPDGDGQFEDLNGNGQLDYDDVVVLFESGDSPVIGNNADLFDFNDNGRFDFNDIVRLFEEV
jgi:plastocyanin